MENATLKMRREKKRGLFRSVGMPTLLNSDGNNKLRIEHVLEGLPQQLCLDNINSCLHSWNEVKVLLVFMANAMLPKLLAQ
ncbi:hypothetical protein VNO77_25250 [Canavalia gladiata]|uniref:Uncharacterized protein n=1 Tax=Canavalia gladiata TaxID=3824 RepID=A0AAN9QDB2_CANGL